MVNVLEIPLRCGGTIFVTTDMTSGFNKVDTAKRNMAPTDRVAICSLIHPLQAPKNTKKKRVQALKYIDFPSKRP